MGYEHPMRLPYIFYSTSNVGVCMASTFFGPIMLNKIFKIIAVTEPQTIPFEVNTEAHSGNTAKIFGTKTTPAPKPTAIAATMAFSGERMISGASIVIP